MKAYLALLGLFLATTALAVDYPVNTAPIGPTSRECGYSVVARLGDLFLAVWAEGGGLRAMRIDASGKPVDPHSFLITSKANPYSFYVVASGTEAFVWWGENLDSPPIFRLVRVDGNGVVKPITLPPVESLVAIGVNEQNILLLSRKPGTSTPAVTLLDRDGSLIRANVPFAIAAGRLEYPRLVALDDGFLVVYYAGVDLKETHFVRLTTSDIRNGSIPPGDQLLARGRYLTSTAVARNGSHVMALWSDEGTAAYVMPVQEPGATTAGKPFYVGAFGVSSMIPFGDGFLATLYETQNRVIGTVLVRISPRGEVMSLTRNVLDSVSSIAASGSSVVAVSTLGGQVSAAPVVDGTIGTLNLISLTPANNQRVQALFATSSGAFVVWTEAGPNERVLVGRIDENGKPLDGAGLRLRVSSENQFGIAAAFDGRKALVVWVESSKFSAPSNYGAIVDTASLTVERVFQLNGNVTGSIAAAWNGSEFVVVFGRWPQFDLAAVRVSRAGQLIDVVPAVLTPPRPSDYNGDALPRISWNGTEYLLVWQRQHYFNLGPGIPECVCITVGDLYAQRVTRDLFPDGAPIAISDHPGYSESSADDFDLASADGTWLVAWSEHDSVRRLEYSAFLRIDSSGKRLDPLNGRMIPGLDPIAAKHVVVTNGSWKVASGTRIATVMTNGDTTAPKTLSPGTIDAMTDTPFPMLGYSAESDGELRAYIHLVPGRRRAIR